jgi:hypothetical protein
MRIKGNTLSTLNPATVNMCLIDIPELLSTKSVGWSNNPTMMIGLSDGGSDFHSCAIRLSGSWISIVTDKTEVVRSPM